MWSKFVILTILFTSSSTLTVPTATTSSDIVTIHQPVNGSLIEWHQWSANRQGPLGSVSLPLNVNIDFSGQTAQVDKLRDEHESYSLCYHAVAEETSASSLELISHPVCVTLVHAAHFSPLVKSEHAGGGEIRLGSARRQTYRFVVFAWLQRTADEPGEAEFAPEDEKVKVGLTHALVTLAEDAEDAKATKNPPREDFTVIIQGPLNAVSLRSIPDYLKVAERVIVSCWAGDDLALLRPVLDGNRALPVDLVVQQLPRVPAQSSSWELTTLYQFWSTRSALQLCRSRFALKVRSDEAFADLGPLARRVAAFPNALSTGNVYLLLSGGNVVSDHIYGGATELLLGAAERVAGVFTSSGNEAKLRPHLGLYFPGPAPHSAEKLLLRAFLDARAAVAGHRRGSCEAGDATNELGGARVTYGLGFDLMAAVEGAVELVPVASMVPYRLAPWSRTGWRATSSGATRDFGRS